MADLPLVTGNRVVWLGDSITDAKKWTHYVSAYLILMNPDLLLHLQTEGRGGSTMAEVMDSGDHNNERYNRRVRAYSPDFIPVMFGHNGGLDAATWRAQFDEMIDDYFIAISGATPVLIGPHPTADATGKPILGQYSTELADIATLGGYEFCDTWNTLLSLWTNPANWSLIGGVDDVHPGTAGHIAIAYTVITELGWTTAISSATIAANTLTVTSQTECAITGVSSNAFGGVNFSRLDNRLPWAFDENGRADAIALIPDIEDFLEYMLTVTGLAAGTYDIYIDNEFVTSKTDVELGAGWNMATLANGPIFDQCQEVLGRIRDMHDVSRTPTVNDPPANNPAPTDGVQRYRSVTTNAYVNLGYWSHPQDMASETNVAAALVSIASLDDLLHTAAQPVNRTYSLRLQGFTEATLNITTLNATTLTVG